MLALRVTRSYTALKPFFEKLVGYSDKLVVYQHDESSRVHVHALVVNCKPSTDTLKNWIRTVVGKVEKTDWSFVAKDVTENFITYMSKGSLAPMCCHGFTIDQIEAYKMAWEHRPKSFKQQKLTFVVKETTEQRKMRQEDMIAEIVKRYKELPHPYSKDLIQLIYKVVSIENRNVLGRFKLRDYYDTVMARVENKDWLEAMNQICKKDYF